MFVHEGFELIVSCAGQQHHRIYDSQAGYEYALRFAVYWHAVVAVQFVHEGLQHMVAVHCMQ